LPGAVRFQDYLDVAILFGYVALLVCHLDEPQDALLLCAKADHDSTALSAAVGLAGNSVSEKRRMQEISFREPRTPEARFPEIILLGSSMNRGNPHQTRT
jgi:hypothetical protein